MASTQEEVTQCLQAMRQGDAEAADRLVPYIYDGLREIAAGMFRKQRPDQTLQPTALVHEAYLKLVGAAGTYNDRTHFLKVAAQAMRQVLTDHARRRETAKRGGGQERLDLLDDVLIDNQDLRLDMATLSDLLEQLETVDPRLAQTFQLRYLSGLSLNEIADIVERSPRTVRLDCKMALAWVRSRMED